ncbi:MAG TPA: hypothetical protein VF155_11305 [Candidatus Dormibacteraeota bacterium]
MTETDDRWERYGRAMLQAMQEVLAETPADLHPLLLETADYWLSLGLAIGRNDPDAAAKLLDVIEADGPERAELDDDAAQFSADALA